MKFSNASVTYNLTANSAMMTQTTYNGYNTYITPSSPLAILGDNPSILTEKYEINLNELYEDIKAIKERLLIIDDIKNHPEYPSLEKAYDNFKVVEKMVTQKC